LAGIYIHIPFCKRKCSYCNFFSVASGKLKNAFFEVLLKEIQLHRSFLAGITVHTIYFGGGTPSLLQPSEIQRILDELVKCFLVSGNAEISLEANPDDLGPVNLKEFRTAGINRLSIGVQSFFDEDLAFLNRQHRASQTLIAIESALMAGFHNLSIDLIYGVPTLTDEKWGENLDSAISLKIPHISAYALTVEPHTALEVLIRKGKAELPAEESTVRHFRLAQRKLKDAGYIHYEISNFCLDGFESRHNSNYWKGIHYLGLGPSAHSFNGTSRRWNIANLTEYIKNIGSGQQYWEEEWLTPAQQYNEYVMTSLRTCWGCDSDRINVRFGKSHQNHFVRHVSKYLDSGMICKVDNIYSLTGEGMLFADGIASDLFIVEPKIGS